jgi:hypothetical protein
MRDHLSLEALRGRSELIVETKDEKGKKKKKKHKKPNNLAISS